MKDFMWQPRRITGWLRLRILNYQRRALLSFVAFMIVLTGCSVGDNPLPQFGWCFTFNFATSHYNVGFTAGSWEATNGLTTDGSGNLSVSYVHDRTVSPERIDFQVVPEEDDVAMTITVTGIVFGLTPNTANGTLEVNVPADFNEGWTRPVTLEKQAAGEEGANFNVTLHSTEPLAIRLMTVYGNGPNPFNVNHCEVSDETPTPINTIIATGTPITYTPSWTNTPTDTLTPSTTPTPSNTPTCTTWEYVIDNNSSYVTTVNGSWNGSKWIVNDVIHGDGNNWYRLVSLRIDFPQAGTLTSATLNYDLTKGSYNAATNPALYFQPFGQVFTVRQDFTTAGTAIDRAFTPLTWTGDEIYVQVVSSQHVTTGTGVGSGSGAINSVTLRGTGTNPFTGGSGCPTPTPTSTAFTSTPSPTRTPDPNATPSLPPPVFGPTAAPTWCYRVDFRTGLHLWILDEGQITSGGLSSNSTGVDNLRVTSPEIANAAYTQVRLTFNSVFSGRAPQVLLASDATLSEIYAIRHGTIQVSTNLSIAYSGIEQFTLDIDRDRFSSPGPQYFDNLRLQTIELRGTGENPFGVENCAPVPTATRGILTTPTPVDSPAPTSTVLLTYTLMPSQTLTPSLTVNPTLSVTVTLTRTPDLGIGEGEMVIPWENGIGSVDTTMIDGVNSTGGNLIDFAGNVWSQGQGFLGTLSGSLNIFLGSWSNSPAIAIPGTPRCASDRFASELCAIWYILTWTVLIGPVGSLIIPMAVITMDTVILFSFIKFVRGIIERLARLQNVQ